MHGLHCPQGLFQYCEMSRFYPPLHNDGFANSIQCQPESEPVSVIPAGLCQVRESLNKLAESWSPEQKERCLKETGDAFKV
jgi:hypothetical protein